MKRQYTKNIFFSAQGHISNQCPQRQGDKGGRKSFGGKPGGGFNKGGFNNSNKFGGGAGGFKRNANTSATTEPAGKVTKFED